MNANINCVRGCRLFVIVSGLLQNPGTSDADNTLINSIINVCQRRARDPRQTPLPGDLSLPSTVGTSHYRDSLLVLQSGHMTAWNMVTRRFGVRQLAQYAGVDQMFYRALVR